MKVRNLLFIGFAAIAMAGCSNSEDIVDNSQLTGEKANMRIRFSFSNDVKGTRASSATEAGTDAGEEFEWKAAKITVVLDYGTAANRVVIPNLNLVSEPNANNKDKAKYSTGEFEVEAGSSVNVYAFVNPSNLAITPSTNLDNLLVGAQVLPTTGLSYLSNTVAKSGNFLMSGKRLNQTIVAGEVNNCEIAVDRVAAKLDELTDRDKEFVISAPTVVGANFSVKIVGHSFSNLASDSYVLEPNAASWTGAYLQTYIPQGGVATANSYRWLNSTGVTYCLENYANNHPTNAHYQAKVYFNGVEATETFYTKATYISDTNTEVRAYKTWAELQAAYSNQFDDSKKNDDAYLKGLGIKRYDSGLCYYEAPILHAGNVEGIYRNNWYKLTVSKIQDLGTPTPVKEGADGLTKLVLNADIEPWTVQIVDIEL